MSSCLKELPDVCATATVEALKKDIQIEGVKDITSSDLMLLEDRLVKRMETLLTEKELGNSTISIGNAEMSSLGSNAGGAMREGRWKCYQWKDNRFGHTVPEGWRFPTKRSVATLWNLWHFGYSDGNDVDIRPFKKIRRSIDLIKEDQNFFSRAKIVMESMESLIKSNDLISSEIDFEDFDMVECHKEEVNEAFHKGFEILTSKIYPVNCLKERLIESCYSNIYKHIITSKDSSVYCAKKRKRVQREIQHFNHFQL